jgi:hypothetical protein
MELIYLCQIFIHSDDMELAVKLITEGADFKLKHDGRTALYEAIISDQGQLAAWLILGGANIYDTSPEGIQLYELAMNKGTLASE